MNERSSTVSHRENGEDCFEFVAKPFGIPHRNKRKTSKEGERFS